MGVTAASRNAGICVYTIRFRSFEAYALHDHVTMA